MKNDHQKREAYVLSRLKNKFKLTRHGFDPDNFDLVGHQNDCHALYDDPFDPYDPLGDDLLGDDHHLCDLDNDLYFDHYFDHYLLVYHDQNHDLNDNLYFFQGFLFQHQRAVQALHFLNY